MVILHEFDQFDYKSQMEPQQQQQHQQILMIRRDVSSINDYERLDFVSEGISAQIFRARHRVSNRIVAVKKYSSCSLDPKSEYHREVFALQQLQNQDHVVQLLDVAQSADHKHPFVVLEYFDTDMDRMLRKKGPFSVDVFQKLLRQLLLALRAVHRLGLVHRDVKPANLLLDQDGHILKLADFGHARLVINKDCEGGSMSPVAGTLWYCAPESLASGSNLFEFARSQATAMDIWSVGCVAVEMLLGRPFFVGANQIGQFRSILDWFDDEVDVRIRLAEQLPLLSSTGVNLISLMLQLDSNKRITAAEALSHDFFLDM